MASSYPPQRLPPASPFGLRRLILSSTKRRRHFAWAHVRPEDGSDRGDAVALAIAMEAIPSTGLLETAVERAAELECAEHGACDGRRRGRVGPVCGRRRRGWGSCQRDVRRAPTRCGPLLQGLLLRLLRLLLDAFCEDERVCMRGAVQECVARWRWSSRDLAATLGRRRFCPSRYGGGRPVDCL
ncbi:hypothetical protein BD413DRAFT_546545 [Trametes elegans]|nr:hypothetical protein BD413DRAFT_546545 [Trametes elegans]